MKHDEEGIDSIPRIPGCWFVWWFIFVLSVMAAVASAAVYIAWHFLEKVW